MVARQGPHGLRQLVVVARDLTTDRNVHFGASVLGPRFSP